MEIRARVYALLSVMQHCVSAEHGDDLAAGNSFVGDARTVKSRSQLDASASLNVTDRITLSADAFKLTDATRSEYQSDLMLPRRIDYDGRTYQLTLRATF